MHCLCCNFNEAVCFLLCHLLPCVSLSNPTRAACRCDVASREEATAAAHLAAGAAPSVGLVHAAGTLADAPLGSQTPALLRRVFAPKAAAERTLSQARLSINR
jgi:KR domain